MKMSTFNYMTFKLKGYFELQSIKVFKQFLDLESRKIWWKGVRHLTCTGSPEKTDVFDHFQEQS